jgi:hypothetical protein
MRAERVLLTEVRHVTLDVLVNVLRIPFDLLQDFIGLGFEGRHVEFVDGALMQMACQWPMPSVSEAGESIPLRQRKDNIV